MYKRLLTNRLNSDKMSNKLHKHWQSFQHLQSAKSPQLRKSLLQHYSKSDEFCSACREISKNIVRRKLLITGSRASKLKRYKKLISQLARANNSRQVKRRLVNQSGGWLPLVIPLISGISSVVGEIIRSRRR